MRERKVSRTPENKLMSEQRRLRISAALRNKVTGENEEAVRKKNGRTERKRTKKAVANKQTYPSFPVRGEFWQVSLKQE